VYSLVSAALLAQDVARHPHAVRLSDVLDRVLALTPQQVRALQGPAPDAVRRRVLETCDVPQVAGALRELAREIDGRERPVEVLEAALLGTLADLHDLLLREQPLRDAPTAARQVALDAVTAAWAGVSATLSDVTTLAAPFADALPPVGPPLADTPRTAEVRDLLEQLARRTPQAWERTAQAHRAHRAGRRWSQAMHEACRAAHDANRLHEVARAQLAAARGLVLTCTGSTPSAVAMAVTAAVQAACTADVLPAATLATLRSDWEAGS
jgi:hypothetical protein